MEAKFDQKSVFFHGFVPKRFQDAPRQPQVAPKMLQDARRRPKDGPRPARGRARRAPRRPETPPDRPRRQQDPSRAPKSPPRRPRSPKMIPKWSQVGTNIGSITALILKTPETKNILKKTCISNKLQGSETSEVRPTSIQNRF